MVEMELAPIQTQIDNQVWQLEQVSGQLTRDEERKAESLNLVLQERQREIDNEKERKTNIANIGIAVAQMGVPQSELEKIMNAETYEKAIQLAAPYLKEKLTIQQQVDLINGGYKLDAEGNVVVDYFKG